MCEWMMRHVEMGRVEASKIERPEAATKERPASHRYKFVASEIQFVPSFELY